MGKVINLEYGLLDSRKKPGTTPGRGWGACLRDAKVTQDRVSELPYSMVNPPVSSITLLSINIFRHSDSKIYLSEVQNT